MTSDAPGTMYVLLRDEEAAGRIIVKLAPYVRFSRKIDKQIARLERQTLKKYPQLLQRGVFGRTQRAAQS